MTQWEYLSFSYLGHHKRKYRCCMCTVLAVHMYRYRDVRNMYVYTFKMESNLLLLLLTPLPASI